MADKDYFTTVHRSMLSAVREVGAMPFLLFEYYMTYSTAKEIRPSLETIAKDLGILDKKGRPSKSAVCNLKKILIEKGWIKEVNGVIFLLKSFRNSEQHSENLNDLSENLNDSFRNSERLYKDEKENKKEKLEEESLSPRETPKTHFGNQSGILAADLIEDEEKHVLLNEVFDGLRTRLGTPSTLPKEFRWREAVVFTWSNRFTAARFLQTYDLLDLIRKRKGKNWQITPEMIESNIADVEKLEIELRSLENGTGKQIYSNNQPKRTDAQVFAESADFYANFPN